MKKNIYSILIPIIIFLFTSYYAKTQIIVDAKGEWNFTVPATDILEAGEDFAGTYKSAKKQVRIDVYQSFWWWNLFYNYKWRIDIEKLDVDWHPNLEIWVRRTGDGTPYWSNGPIWGGSSYQQINNFSQYFFGGRRSRLDIPIQYKIKNVSVLLPAKTYSTTIIYTVTEL